MKHQACKKLLADYALGGLSDAQRRRVRAHLAEGCADCAAKLKLYRAVGLGLGQALPPRPAAPGVKARLMGRLGPERSAPAYRSWAWPRAWPLAALASLALLWVVAPPFAGHKAAATDDSTPRLLSGHLLADGRSLALGEAIPWGAALLDPSDGPVRVQVGDRAALLLQAGTRARLTREGGGLRLDLPHGTVFSALRPGTPFQVRAGRLRVDAHGTVFLVHQVEPGRAYVCICRGSIQVRAPGLDQILESHNDAQERGLDLSLAADKTLARAAKPAYYTDADEDALADAVGLEH